MTAWKESIYRKHPWIIPIVPFIILYLIIFVIISQFLTMLCPVKVSTSFNRFGSKITGWIPKVEVVREFTHAGFKCLVHKKKSGSLAGYVVLPREHPYYGKGPDYISDLLDREDRLSCSTPPRGADPWEVGIHTHEWADHDIDFVESKTKQLAEQLAIKRRGEKENDTLLPLS